MKHYTYEKITSNLAKYKLDEAAYRKFTKTQWVVTEKIHGANFCILTDGRIIQFAKRKTLLETGEDFFAYSLIAKSLQNKVRQLFILLSYEFKDLTKIAVYGELYGGEYPHDEVAPIGGLQAIQTGIYYSPSIQFSAFDIAYTNTNGERQYCDFKYLEKYCDQVELQYCKPLLIGSYEEALSYPIGFQSTIPYALGLPPLAIDNKAEGIVIKPFENFEVDTIKGKLRPVLKKKIPAFSEDKRYQEAQKWRVQSKQQTRLSLSEFYEKELLPLITNQRLDNTISKIGKWNKRNRKRIERLFVEDIWETLEENSGNQLHYYKKELLNEFLEKEVNMFLKRKN
ncbi:MAG: hypothetical protein MK212_11740 [Saprospiraceae bacterium]|nr:hypothetical protein [Saprospiraceae bacterium]